MSHTPCFNPKSVRLLVLGLAVLLLGACDNMRNMPRHEPLELSPFFPDNRSARQLVEGSIPWGQPEDAEWLSSGMNEDGTPIQEYPFEVTLEVLQRGRERYDIYCSPCHGLDGYGEGMIVQRGFAPPPSLHIDRLRQAPPGYYVNVITHGFGQMYPYDYRVAALDRWAIAAYIRALQLSQNASTEDVPEQELQGLQGASQ